MKNTEKKKVASTNQSPQGVGIFVPPQDDDVLLDYDHLCAWLGIKRRTANEIVARGEIHTTQVSPQKTRFRAGDVRDYIAKKNSGRGIEKLDALRAARADRKTKR